MIDIKGLDKALVLAALYNRARPQGMGFLQYTPEDMTREEAEELLKTQASFDYLYGRVMKVSFAGAAINESLYDRDNGNGAAAEAVAVASRGLVNDARLSLRHHHQVIAAARDSDNAARETTETMEYVEGLGNVPTISMEVDPVVPEAAQKAVDASSRAFLAKMRKAFDENATIGEAPLEAVAGTTVEALPGASIELPHGKEETP